MNSRRQQRIDLGLGANPHGALNVAAVAEPDIFVPVEVPDEPRPSALLLALQAVGVELGPSSPRAPFQEPLPSSPRAASPPPVIHRFEFAAQPLSEIMAQQKAGIGPEYKVPSAPAAPAVAPRAPQRRGRGSALPRHGRLQTWSRARASPHAQREAAPQRQPAARTGSVLNLADFL